MPTFSAVVYLILASFTDRGKLEISCSIDIIGKKKKN